MVRGRTTAPTGMVLGTRSPAKSSKPAPTSNTSASADLVTVPFNVACGRCITCREQQTGVCLNVNPGRAGGAYGYVDMGGWVGGQPSTSWSPTPTSTSSNSPTKPSHGEDQRPHHALRHPPYRLPRSSKRRCRRRLHCLHRGAGPVGLAAAASAQILGAAVVMIGDMNPDRLKHAASVGFVPIDLTKSDNLGELIAAVVGKPEVDAAVDAVGFEARAQGKNGAEAPATVLNSLMSVVRAAGGIGIPGLYVTEDPGSHDEAAKQGNLKMRFGLGWAKSHRFYTGQTPVLKYNRQLMQAILHDRLPSRRSSTQLSSH